MANSFHGELLSRHTKTIREEVPYKVLFDLRMSYDALDMENFLEILVGYGVGPRMEILLHHYCEHLLMVAQDGHYYGSLFKGYICIDRVQDSHEEQEL